MNTQAITWWTIVLEVLMVSTAWICGKVVISAVQKVFNDKTRRTLGDGINPMPYDILQTQMAVTFMLFAVLMLLMLWLLIAGVLL
jgi:hypothetical protein